MWLLSQEVHGAVQSLSPLHGMKQTSLFADIAGGGWHVWLLSQEVHGAVQSLSPLHGMKHTSLLTFKVLSNGSAATEETAKIDRMARIADIFVAWPCCLGFDQRRPDCVSM